VFFASPTEKQVCPKSAACWSPRSPATAMPPRSPLASPYTSLDARTCGSMARGMPRMPRISSSQSSVSRFISIVRLAFVTSVTWAPPPGPPVRFQITHVSMLPKRISPFSARPRAPSMLSRIHLIFGPEKYVAIGRPVFARKRSWPPSAISWLQIWSVRVSCQTIAL
jgi:hypothetical protein